MSELNEIQAKRLFKTQRPFAIKIDGIWRRTKGVYIQPYKNPFRIQCIYQGKTIVVEGNKHFADLNGCSEAEVDAEVISYNIASLPLRKIMPKLTKMPPRAVRGVVRRVAAQPSPRPYNPPAYINLDIPDDLPTPTNNG